jgi:Family of unknown function (DUF5678)
MQNASTRIYRENRASFPLVELRKFAGQWVAFSADGLRIIASAPTIVELTGRLREGKHEVRDVVVERIESETDEINLGAAELS